MRQDINIHLHEQDQIRCECQLSEREALGYPVLILEGTRGTLTIFPGVERLERLHAVIGAYLMAHRRPVPAEACVDVDELIAAEFER